MSFKALHEFTITIDREVEDIVTRTEGDKQITERSKSVKPVQAKVLLKEPTRKEKQELSLFQTITYNEAVNLGLLPRLTMVQKISRDQPLGDGDLTLAAIQTRLQELANDYIRMGADKTSAADEVAARKAKAESEWLTLRKKAVDIETSYQSVFAHTAEMYTQNRMLMWITLYLTYLKVGPDKYEPMFKGADFKGKEESLGELEDKADPIYLASVETLSRLATYYLFGQASKPEEFAHQEEERAKELEAFRKAREELDGAAKEKVVKVEEGTIDVVTPAEATPTVA